MAEKKRTTRRLARNRIAGGNGSRDLSFPQRLVALKKRADGGDPKAGLIIAKLASVAAERTAISAQLGKQAYADSRDIYAALGYKKNPTFADYLSMYRRAEVARAVIDRPVRASWRKPPIITEAAAKETEFERGWLLLEELVKPWHYFQRADRLAGIGEYSVILIGFDDSAPLSEEVTSAQGVLYLMPYSANVAAIESVVTDTKNPRYSLPEKYKINMEGGIGGAAAAMVHWSRVIHVANDRLENDVRGTPSLEVCFNTLTNIERVAGGCGEMFWRGAFPGLAFIKDSDATFGKQDEDDLTDEMEDYLHGFQRYLRIEGMQIQQLAPEVADPSHHVDVFLKMIAIATGIPKRILEGSERGELSSAQDERTWAEMIEERQQQHCEPTILRPFIERCQMVGVLPQTPDGYNVEWPDLLAKSDKDIADVGKTMAETIKAYVETPGAEMILPVELFLQWVLGLSKDQTEQAMSIAEAESDEANAVEPQLAAEPADEGVAV